jgi:hypothetical protein
MVDTVEEKEEAEVLGWDPVSVGSDLSSKVSSRSRHISLLLGAGTSRPAGLPDVKGLLALVLADVSGTLKPHAERIFDGRVLEDGLSRIRRIKSLLEAGEQFEGLTSDLATELDAEVSQLIIEHLKKPASDMTAHNHLASWIVGEYYTRPIEIFTINYDLLIEEALESLGASYADGFVGNLQATFRAELVESTGAPDDTYPSSFARLWKLHGSLNWRVDGNGRVVRTGAATSAGQVAAIYPSDEKYDESRRVPFTVLQDRFRKALAVPESLTLVSGYSFGDQHLNEIIFDAARRYPRSEIIVFCHGAIDPTLEGLNLPNLSVYGATEAVIGSERRPWKTMASAPESLWKDGKFVLGDFASLASFLSRSSRVERWPERPADLADMPTSTGASGGVA